MPTSQSYRGCRRKGDEWDEVFWFWFMRKSAEMWLEVGEPAVVDQALCECMGVLTPEDPG